MFDIKIERIESKPGYWNTQKVNILQDGVPIGSYIYKYSGNVPWLVFQQNGKDYALYADDYTATKVMSLPSCEQIAGDPPGTFGFCPVDFTVEPDGMSGTVTGCVWACPYEIYQLDLSRISEGIFNKHSPVYEEVEWDDDEED